MKAKDLISTWRDWPAADQMRYRDLAAKVRAKIRVPIEDWTWWVRRDRAIKFYTGIARRHAARSSVVSVRHGGFARLNRL